MSRGSSSQSRESSVARPLEARTVRVRLARTSYEVLIGGGLLNHAAERVRLALPAARRAALFIDEGLGQNHAAGLIAGLDSAGIAIAADQVLTVRPSEPDKSLKTFERLLAVMTAARLDRGDVAIVLGGGVLGDMVGFAAASYRRGVAWVNCPTTLLSMVDASVGGKTGVNLEVGGSLKKNMVGAFHQPSLVVADVRTLAALPDRQFRAGLAECIKHGMLSAEFGEPDLGRWITMSMDKILGRDEPTLVELVARNISIKAMVVMHDEFEEAADEQGGRALLNLGHTFGHVIETLAHLTPDGEAKNAPLHHGEAVGLGLIAASAAAGHVGLVHADFVRTTRRKIQQAGLPIAVQGLAPNSMLAELMLHDKKVTAGRLRLVLPCDDQHARCRVIVDPRLETVCAGWDAIRA